MFYFLEAFLKKLADVFVYSVAAVALDNWAERVCKDNGIPDGVPFENASHGGDEFIWLVLEIGIMVSAFIVGETLIAAQVQRLTYRETLRITSVFNFVAKSSRDTIPFPIPSINLARKISTESTM